MTLEVTHERLNSFYFDQCRLVLLGWCDSFCLNAVAVGPKTAIRGNRFGMVAMAIAVITTFFLAEGPVLWLIIGAMVLGAIVGMWKAKTVA